MLQTSKPTPVSYRRLALLAVALSTLILAGCNGGGGGGSSATSTTPTYSGVTTQATVATNNAQPLTASTLQAGSAGTTVTATGVVSSGGTAGAGESRFIMLANPLKTAIGQIDVASAGGVSVMGAMMQPYSKMVSSPYGSGNMSLALDYDSVTGNFNGTVSFSGYCESAGSCVNGVAGISGQLNPNTQALMSGQFTVTGLNVTENGDMYQFAGSIGMNVLSTTSTRITESCVIADSTGTYKLDNLVFVVTDNMTYADAAINSGRFYHPAYGYVDVKTVMPLRYSVTNGVMADWPYQGSMELDGASNTKALLTALSDSPNVMPQWQLQADTNGDGAWDMTLSGNWANL